MAVIHQISGYQTSECNEILTTDITVYGSSPDTREEYGIALFVSVDVGGGFVNDPSMSDLTNPGITGTPGEWSITIINQQATYQIDTFLCPLWVVGTVRNEDDIVFYATEFWRRTSTNPGTNPTPTALAPEWELMDGTNYTEFVTSSSQNTQLGQDFVQVYSWPNYQRIRTGTRAYSILDKSNNAWPKRVSIETYDGTSVYLNQGFTDDRFDFTTTEDNVYIINVEEDRGDGYISVHQEPLYDYTALQVCYAHVVNEQLCREFDPCCEDCDTDTILQGKKQRYGLNQLTAFWNQLLRDINEDYLAYLNIYEVDDDRLSFLERDGELILKIKTILERCGLCDGALSISDTDVSFGCTSCN